MPVIIGERKLMPLDAAQRRRLREQLERELSGAATQNGPVIFQVPLERRDTFDVIVVWKAWKDIDMEDRRDVILSAYGDQKQIIDLALGVTYDEAAQQQLLPYAVVPLIRKEEKDPNRLREAMLQEGGMRLPDGNVDLRFPTMAMAEAALRKLSDEIPKGHWSIVQEVRANLP